jgi:hypothetical protein
MIEVSFFKGGITDVVPTKHANIVSMLEAVKNGYWKTQIEALRNCEDAKTRQILKNKLPYFTASGTFKKRKDTELIKHSGLIQLDFDNVLYTSDVQNEISKEPSVFASFLSPSATGIKVLVRILPEQHTQVFWALYGYFLAKYGIMADTRVRDVSRAFFISYDENLYLNENAEIWKI